MLTPLVELFGGYVYIDIGGMVLLNILLRRYP